MKKIIVFAVLAAVLAGSVFAQSLPSTGGLGFTSPQSTATQGRIRSNADDFMRPDAFAGVRFENWFGMASFANTLRASLGYATRFGGGEDGSPLYLGAFYTGSFWANAQTTKYTEQRTSWLGNEKNDVKTYDSTPALDTNALPANQIALLFGLEKMGFRLSLNSTYKSFKDTKFAVMGTPFIPGDPDADPPVADTPAGPNTYYKSIDSGRGIIAPQLAWSMTGNLVDGKGVRPWATVDLIFNKNFSKNQQYVQDGASWVAGNETVSNSQNFTSLVLNLGLGGFILANENGWRTSTDLEYRLQADIFDNEYNYQPATGYAKISSFSGNNVNGTLNERSYVMHTIRPILSTQWNGDKLRLRAKLDLNINISSDESIPVTADASGTLKKNGLTEEESIFGFNPDLRLAAQWQVASKLFLNFGARVNLNALEITTTTGEFYSDNTKQPNTEYKTVATSYGGTTNTLTLGVTLNATDNLFLEASAGIGGNRLNVFDTSTGGAFNFGSILAGVRF